VIFLSPKVCSREEDILKQADEHVGYIIYDPKRKEKEKRKMPIGKQAISHPSSDKKTSNSTTI
jgi:hypothetical protein